VKEVRHYIKRTLKRLDVTARSLFALIEPGSCFAGTFLELALAADRSYMLDDPDRPTAVQITPAERVDVPDGERHQPPPESLPRRPRAASRPCSRRPAYDRRRRRGGRRARHLRADDIDWEDEVRLAVEERASLSPDALTGMEANLRFAGPENMETKIFGRLSAWQNWIFQRPNAVGERGALTLLRPPTAPRVRLQAHLMSQDPETTLRRRSRTTSTSPDRRLGSGRSRSWQPHFIDWWKDMGPEGFQADDIYLRTAVSVDAGGWAHFELRQDARLPLGHLPHPPTKDRKVGFGDMHRPAALAEVPGEFRNALRRLIVTQGDTEPASVEQQRCSAHTAPSSTTCATCSRSTWRRAATCGPWSTCCTLLRTRRPRGGRGAARAPLRRRRQARASSSTFNEPIEDWLSFFMFTMFTDRDGKFQLLALAESGFDPLSRTCRFMLTEEAHHMFVGETGVERVIRAARS
jgi:hypothetical protein